MKHKAFGIDLALVCRNSLLFGETKLVSDISNHHPHTRIIARALSRQGKGWFEQRLRPRRENRVVRLQRPVRARWRAHFAIRLI